MKTAMLLAAGRGERLKPLTNHLPKALCEVSGKPLIVWHVERLRSAGFSHLVINHAWLGGHIRACLGNGQHFGVDIDYAPEPPGGLETGGGIYNARHLLGTAPFITVNADIFTDFPFETLTLTEDALVKLVLVKNPFHNADGDFGLLKDERLSNRERGFTAAGITCYHPSVLEGLKPGRYRIAPLWRALADNGKAFGMIHTGTWTDIGTIERLTEAQALV